MSSRLARLAAAALLAVGLAFPASAAEDLKDVKASVESGKAVLVDVREPKEWQGGHLRDARSMPMSEFAAGRAALDTLPKDKPVYLYCAIGSRSKRVAAFLKGKGFDARAIPESYRQLLAAGFPESR